MKSLLRHTALAAVLAAAPAIAAPVLVGPPPRALTDPKTVVSAPDPAAPPVPIADLYYVRGAADAAWSADGKAIVLSTNLTGRFNLWTMPAAGGFPLQLTQSDDRQSGIGVTAAGQVIFESDKAGAEIYDLYATPLAGGETVDLTNTPDVSETSAHVAPGGTLIAFLSRPKAAPSNDVAVMDLATRQTRQLTHEAAPDRDWNLQGFTADGKTVIATRADFTDIHGAVYALDVATGAAKALTPEGGYALASAVAPDGRHVAVTVRTEAGVKQAALLDVATGKTALLAPGPWEQSSGDFSPDGSTLIFSSNVDGRQTLFAYALATGASRPLPLPDGVNDEAPNNAAAFSPDGTKVLVGHQAGNTSFDLWVADLASGRAAPITRLGLASIDPAHLPRSELVHYPSADGTVISAFLWTPFNLKRDGTAPGVVVPHGGPTGQTVDSFNRTALALASRGYVVIAPNPRGSTGYGQAFQDANRKDLGGGDLEDEVAGAKFLTETGYVDAKKIGITGGSYGGYMTLMAVAKTPPVWAAGVEEYGIIDWEHMYRTEAPPLQQYQRGLLGAPDTDAAVYKATSPMTYIHQTTAPLLVLQGDNDIRVPRSQAEQVVAALKADGRTVDAHFYPNEGHGFLKRENQIDALTRTVDWFDEHLKGGAGK